MDDLTNTLEQPSHAPDGGRSITREQAVAATRARGVDEVDDDEIWAVWQRHDNGPTNAADLDRVVAELEGIALDG